MTGALARTAAGVLLLCSLGAAAAQPPAAPGSEVGRPPLESLFASQVDMRLDVPPAEQHAYAQRLAAALAAAGLSELAPQVLFLVDRNPFVQAILVYALLPEGGWRFVGASPVSTGSRGGFEYFLTPLGVFAHTLENMDFRAEGTFTDKGIRGYGVRGMRVFDFGWGQAERTWGSRGRSPMRLQVHATDPDLLEGQLGRPRSKGCIRIPASLNRFLDHYGLLDAEYEQAARDGRNLWVLRPDRQPAAGAGKYLVIIDTQRKARPAWSPWPPRRDRVPALRPATGAQAGSVAATGTGGGKPERPLASSHSIC